MTANKRDSGVAVAERMAMSVSMQPCKHRTCERQRNGPNVATTSIEEWYKVIPLARTASSLLHLVLSVL